MSDISYTFNAFEKLFHERYIQLDRFHGIAYLDDLNYLGRPDLLQLMFLQTRLIDYLYNNDNKTLANNNLTNLTQKPDSSIHYLLYTNKFLGVTMKITDFDEETTDYAKAAQEFLKNIYADIGEIYHGKFTPPTDFGFGKERGCSFKNLTASGEANKYLFQKAKTLFIPGNVSTCDAFNIAFLQNDIIKDGNKMITVNMYFLNPVTMIIYNYQLILKREFNHG